MSGSQILLPKPCQTRTCSLLERCLACHVVFTFFVGADLMAFILAFLVEMVLFAFHLHGRPLVDQHIHMLLVYSIAACVVTTLLELKDSQSVNASIARYYT